MGRIFEKRKHKMFARYDKMAKAFTRIGKEIAIAVKAGGDNPDHNPRLRAAMQNAKGVNMPKDRIENAIKRAASKDDKGFEEMVYEGYGPYGVAILIETATDNTTRTVANVRMYFNRGNGALGKTGSLDFLFTRKGVFTVEKQSLGGKDIEELELDLIDYGCEEIAIDDELVYIYTAFTDSGKMQKALEDLKIPVKSTEYQRMPNTWVDLSEDQAAEVLELVENLEADDDVQHVFHNLK
ncbi:MAG: YebC/PmpR family DNA-binding transcriptional regulator [Bacteroidia bacterium]|nr:YebC/PmpR family DNA-binding transcriptional regulator [Bacteroidia bacterium]